MHVWRVGGESARYSYTAKNVKEIPGYLNIFSVCNTSMLAT